MNSKYEILKGLPPYGKMYIPIPENGNESYSEGFVIRFFKNDGTDWVANFGKGWSNYSNVFEFKESNRIIVFANGVCYGINPEIEKELFSIGYSIDNVIQSENGSLIFSDGIMITILDNENGEIWESERISWDGIENLELNGNILSGKSYDPSNSNKEWSDFTLNINTKEIKGGSFRDMLSRNPHLEMKNKIEIQYAEQKNEIEIKQTEPIKKPWWKIW